MTSKVKGMVQFHGVTYRIVRVAANSYTVVRISDDQDVGCFQTAPNLGCEARLIEPALLREIARLAIHTAKTSYSGFPAPMGAAEESSVSRSPSSIPPPTPANG